MSVGPVEQENCLKDDRPKEHSERPVSVLHMFMTIWRGPRGDQARRVRVLPELHSAVISIATHAIRHVGADRLQHGCLGRKGREIVSELFVTLSCVTPYTLLDNNSMIARLRSTTYVISQVTSARVIFRETIQVRNGWVNFLSVAGFIVI